MKSGVSQCSLFDCLNFFAKLPNNVCVGSSAYCFYHRVYADMPSSRLSSPSLCLLVARSQQNSGTPSLKSVTISLDVFSIAQFIDMLYHANDIDT